MMKKKNISFSVGDETLIGHLYFPKLSSSCGHKNPAVVLCHGFAGVKELLLPAYAEAFADAGFIALTFDYRGFGESDGEKGRLTPKLQIEDIHAALDYIKSLYEVDANRIGLWGTSYGGANAIIATAQNKLVKCLSVQLTFGNGHRVVTANMSVEEEEKFMGMLTKMAKKKEMTGKEMLTPLSKVLSDSQSASFYERYSKMHEALNIKIPFLTVQETMNHKPEEHIEAINSPILIVGAEKDGVNPVEESRMLFDKANCIKELLIVEGVEHYACYEGKPFTQIIEKQKAWFKAHLLS